MFPIELTNVDEPIYIAIWNRENKNQILEIHTKKSFIIKYQKTNLFVDANLYDDRENVDGLSMYDIFNALEINACEDFEEDNFYIRRIK